MKEADMDYFLNKDQFEKLYEFLQSERNIHVKKRREIRRFVEAIFWLARSGAQWRLLPVAYGDWNGVYKRFARWTELGVWERMFCYFARDPDMESVLLDSTIVRAHACAAGAKGGSRIR